MSTGSLRARVTLFTLSLLVVVLIVVVTAVTLAYRSSLQNDLRGRLASAGAAVRQAGTGQAAKVLVQGLALEGIATQIERGAAPLPAGKGQPGQKAPIKPGTSITSRGSLLMLEETLSDGTRVTFSSSSAQITHSVLRLLVVELVVALSAFALAVIVLLRGTGRALRPLARVNETATRIAAGDRELRLRPERTDTELGGMAAAFDEMVDALEAALEKAEDAETAMRRFLADASHELRTPVASLQAGAETLLREQPGRPRRDELEADLARQADRLGRLIGDLLSLARLEDADRLPDETVDLARLAEAAADEARRRSPGLTVTLDAREAHTRGDANGIQRALRNLLDNAVTAAAPDGHIGVAVRTGEREAEIRVVDDGPGIPEADRERIFERFVRLDHARAPGTGLGLAIAQRIARRHGGDLTCDAVPDGAAFTLRLPSAAR